LITLEIMIIHFSKQGRRSSNTIKRAGSYGKRTSTGQNPSHPKAIVILSAMLFIKKSMPTGLLMKNISRIIEIAITYHEEFYTSFSHLFIYLRYAPRPIPSYKGHLLQFLLIKTKSFLINRIIIM